MHLNKKKRAALLVVGAVFILSIGAGYLIQRDPSSGAGAPKSLVEVHKLLGLDRAANDPTGHLLSFDIPDRYLPVQGANQQKTEVPAAWGKARKILQHELARGARSAELYVLAGVLAYKWAGTLPQPSGDDYYRQARAAFRKAIQLDPENRDAYWGLTLLDSGPLVLLHPHERPAQELARTIAVFKRLIQLDPKNALALVNLGITYNQMGRLEEAQKLLEAVLALPQKKKVDPIRIEAAEFLGRTYTAMGKYKVAEKLLVDSIRDFESTLSGGSYYKGCPYQAMGELYRAIGKQEASAEYFKKAEQFDTHSIYNSLLQASTGFGKGDYRRASVHVEAILSGNTHGEKDDQVLAAAAVLKGMLSILRKDYAGAEAMFARAEQGKGAAWGTRMGRGHLKLKDRQHEAAAGLFKEAIAGLEAELAHKAGGKQGQREYQLAAYHMALLGLGWVSANKNDHAGAVAWYDQILDKNPDHLMALQSKGVASIALHKDKQAEKIFREVLALQPGNQYARAELGIVELNRGALDKAEALFSKALAEGHQAYTCPYEGLGLVYLRRGQYEKAKHNFKKAISLNPEIEYKKYNGLARIYIREGKYDQAEKLLRKSIQNHPYDKEATELLKKVGRARAELPPK